MSRETIWNADLEDRVVDAVSETGSQSEAAELCGIHRRRIDERELACESFRARIARAREIGYAARAEKAVKDAKTAEDAGKGRLAFDAERWLLSKIAPKQYGDRQVIAGDPDAPITGLSEQQVDDRLAVLLAKRGDV